MRRILYISVLVCFFLPAAAQIDQDTVIRSDDYVVEAPTVKENDEPDTALRSNQLLIPVDSVEYWKNMKEFAYGRYLDSLLKLKQYKANQEIAKNRSRSKGGSVESYDDSSSSSNWLDNIFSSSITKSILYVAAALFVLFILYKLFLADGGFKKRTKTAPVSQPETEEEVLTSESDFDSMIGLALKQGNYRLAVRYQYLKVLHALAEKNLIELSVDKTNYQYVRELASKNSPLVNYQFQNEFANLTLNYEYAWYGEFGVDGVIYRRIEDNFNNFNRKI